MKRPSLQIQAFAACSLIWGSTFLAIRIGNDTLPAIWACALRQFVAALILNGVVLATGSAWPRGAALKAAALYGLWEFGISMPLLYWGERVVSSGLAAVLYAVCPITAMFAARALGMETLDWRRLGAAVLAFAGVAVIFWDELVRGGSPGGLFAVLLAAASAPIAALMLQRGPKQGAVGANAIGTLVAFPVCVAISLAIGERHQLPSTFRSAFPVIYLAVFGSVGAFVIFAWLLGHWKTSTVAFIGVVVPVTAVILGALVRHEVFVTASLLGAAIVLAGVVWALRTEGGSADAVARGELR